MNDENTINIRVLLHIQSLRCRSRTPRPELAWTVAGPRQQEPKRTKESQKQTKAAVNRQNTELAAFSPKRAMVELRHSISIGSRASSSPMKRDGDSSSPLIPDSQPNDDEDHDRPSSKDRDRSFWYHCHSICPFFSDDARFPPYNSRIWLFFLLFLLLLLAALISVFSIVNRLVSILSPRALHFGISIRHFRFSFYYVRVWLLIKYENIWEWVCGTPLVRTTEFGTIYLFILFITYYIWWRFKRFLSIQSEYCRILAMYDFSDKRFGFVTSPF